MQLLPRGAATCRGPDSIRAAVERRQGAERGARRIRLRIDASHVIRERFGDQRRDVARFHRRRVAQERGRLDRPYRDAAPRERVLDERPDGVRRLVVEVDEQDDGCHATRRGHGRKRKGEGGGRSGRDNACVPDSTARLVPVRMIPEAPAPPERPASTAAHQRRVDMPHRWRLCVAPMMDWTDRHCRYFHRQLSPDARLYTEMVTTGALIHGDVPRHLDFDDAEHPVALQLGGSEADALAHCARLGARWGYDEINLNCGCPSERVQNGAFGACLMAEPARVSDCVKAMCDAVDLPVTVKHRIGLDRRDDYGFVRDFVGTVHDAGCDVFIVHARNAWLKGLSPKENREIPPLRPEVVAALKRDFPEAMFVVNGGLATDAAIGEALDRFDGVMIGRAAYHDPYVLARLGSLDRARPVTASRTRGGVVRAMADYADRRAGEGVPLRSIVRHLLGLYHAQPAARTWRRMLSDATLLRDADSSLLLDALDAVEGATARADGRHAAGDDDRPKAALLRA